jgi:hypothetical protein
VRITEVHAHAGGGAEFLMAGHILAMVVGETLAEGGDRVEFDDEAGQCRGGGGVFHLRQQHQATGALNQARRRTTGCRRL